MNKGVLVNNINDINYAQSNLTEYILVTRNPEIKRKYSKIDIKFYRESGSEDIEKYNSIFYLGMNWFRNDAGQDLLCNGGISPPIIFTRRLSIALCEYYKIYNLLKLYFDIFDTIACSINESITFKNVAKYFTDKIPSLRSLPNFNLSIFKFRKNSNYQINEANCFPKEINSIWDGFSTNIKVAVNRNKEYLDWRYIEKPNESYKIAHCYGKDSLYLGCCVYTVKEKHKGKIGYIMELIFDLNNPKSGELLLSFTVDKIKRTGADCILAWCLSHSPNYNCLKNELFFKIPEKYRPIELHFGARVFNEDLEDVVNNRDNWYLSYSDSDTV